MTLSRTLTDALNKHLDRVTRKRGALGPPQVLVRSGNDEFSYGDRSVPFHAASTGKVPTAVLVLQQVEAGAFALDTAVAELIAPGTLDGLFVVDGTDHSASVTVGQLLNHTSGVADYFEGKTLDKTKFVELIKAQPDHLWQPLELIEFTRVNQRAVAKPGARFNYSDTGYILLGLLLEHVTRVPFHELLHSRVFAPLGMRDSYLMFRSTPANPVRPIAPLYLGKTEMSAYTSVSCDWSGGGIVTTLDDLARFSEALHSAKLISHEHLDGMLRTTHRFRPGIHYGFGLMQIRFGEFFFTLRGLPKPTGHIGVLATHMFYDEENDAHIVMNFGGTEQMVQSFRTLIQIESLLSKTREKRDAQPAEPATAPTTAMVPGSPHPE